METDDEPIEIFQSSYTIMKVKIINEESLELAISLFRYVIVFVDFKNAMANKKSETLSDQSSYKLTQIGSFEVIDENQLICCDS